MGEVDRNELEREGVILGGVTAGTEEEEEEGVVKVEVVGVMLEDGMELEVEEYGSRIEDERGVACWTDFVTLGSQTNWQDSWDNALSKLSQTRRSVPKSNTP